jgi:hypothetical protein
MSRLDKPVGKYTADNRDFMPVYHMAVRLLNTPPEQRKAITDTLAPEFLERCRKEAKRLQELWAKESPR